MAHVWEILAELHNDRELSQKELGRVLHIGGGTISCYERGSSLPNSARIAQIADYFHVTTDYLLGRTSYNISPDYLAEPICGEVTVHDFVELLREIPEDRRYALYLLAKDARINATLKKQMEP